MIAICIGHSRFIGSRRDGGAVSVGGVSEWDYNCQLANLIAQNLSNLNISSFIVSRYEGWGYGASMAWLGSHLRKRGATAAIELHFNDSDDPTANGYEWLHWHGSAKGKALAEAVDLAFKDPGFYPIRFLRPRGVKALTSADRGAEFLRLTPCPAVICEPFFGSNPSNWGVAKAHEETIAGAIARGVDNWVRQP